MQLDVMLRIDISSYWHAGTGLSAGGAADAVAERDRHGLPMLGGRHLKGLLRHACECAEKWGWFQDFALPEGPANSLTELLFGEPGSQDTETGSNPGMLLVGDASLPPDEMAWLIHPDNAGMKEALWQYLASTAIDEYGTALDHSLRTVEVVIPVSLQAQVTLGCTAPEEARRQQQRRWLESARPLEPLQMALSLIDAVGAKRTRGLGEATLTLSLPHSGEVAA